MGGGHSCSVLGNPCTQTHQGSSSKGTHLVVLYPILTLTLALFPHPHVWPTLQVPDGHSTSYPSLLSHLTSMSLNAPALALPVAKRQPPDPGLRSFHPLASSPPCDFHLLNLRTLQAEVSILLHPMLSGPKSGLSSPDLPVPGPPSGQYLCTVCHPGRYLAFGGSCTHLTPQGF